LDIFCLAAQLDERRVLGQVLDKGRKVVVKQNMEAVPESIMMRIAIAGSGGLARVIASLVNETPHPFIILSRQVYCQ
jgi:hypothetical protein